MKKSLLRPMPFLEQKSDMMTPEKFQGRTERLEVKEKHEDTCYNNSASCWDFFGAANTVIF